MSKTEAVAEKKKRVRSPNYPAINLEEAIKRAKEFHDREDRHQANIEVASQLWGYKNYASGGSLVIAALTSFGLMNDEGVGPERRVRLSPLGIKILIDQRPNSVDRTEAIRTAALTPKIHKELWDKWGGSPPSNENIQFYLLSERGFNKRAVHEFIDEYRKTLTFAGLLSNAKISPAEEHRPNIQIGDYVEWELGGVLQFECKRIANLSEDGKYAFVDGSETGIQVEQLSKVDPPAEGEEDGKRASHGSLVLKRPPSKPGMNNDVFTLDEGEVILQWPARLSAESYEEFKAWLDLIAKRAKRVTDKKEPTT